MATIPSPPWLTGEKAAEFGQEDRRGSGEVAWAVHDVVKAVEYRARDDRHEKYVHGQVPVGCGWVVGSSGLRGGLDWEEGLGGEEEASLRSRRT